MQQYRWQWLAFIGAVLIFVVALVSRITPPDAAPTPPPTEAVAASPQALTVAQPTPEPPQALAPNTNTVVASSDEIPTFREALVGSVQRINPLYAALNPVDADISALIFEGLVRINEFGEPVPHLAESWVISRDALEYVFTLRTDVRWQDGIPFTSKDVVYTMSLLSDPDFDGLSEMGAFWRTVETTALNERTVRFRLTQPLAPFLTTLTVGILPEHALSGTTAADLASHPFMLTPIGTGPYQLEAVRADDSLRITQVDLRRSPIYRARYSGQALPQIERISFIIHQTTSEALADLQAGRVDAYLAQPAERSALLTMSNVNVYTTLAPTVGVLLYNWNEPEGTRFFTELRARLALLRGLNRVGPVEASLSSQAVTADSPIMPNSWAYFAGLRYPEVNPGDALTLLEGANITTPSIEAETGTLHQIRLIVRDQPALIDLANQIAIQWSQLRLEVRVEPLNEDTFAQRLADADFEAAIVELPLGADPDPFAYWHAGQSPDGKNWGGVNDDRLSELLERARRDPNGINRAVLYRQFQEMFVERAIAIPLYHPLFSYAVRDRVQGVQLGFISTPVDRFRSIGLWTLS
jgi:peptide/nickel transport system substrate-binding protein